MRYPTEQQLVKIQNWQPQDYIGLINYIENIWEYKDEAFKYDGTNLELHTLGWSGNEEIISALKKNTFWFFNWQKSERGGHHYFRTQKPLSADKETADCCYWREIDKITGLWKPDCSEHEHYYDSGPIGFEYKFCPYCGKEIREIPYKTRPGEEGC